MNALYLTATGPLSGKTAAALGIMHMLNLSMRDVAIFRPIINTPQMTDRDPDIHLMMEQFKLRQDYAETFVYTHEEARKVINRGDHDLVIETIMKQFKKLPVVDGDGRLVGVIRRKSVMEHAFDALFPKDDR